MFFCKFCKISKDTFFTEHLRATASKWDQFEIFWCRTIASNRKHIEVPLNKTKALEKLGKGKPWKEISEGFHEAPYLRGEKI